MARKAIRLPSFRDHPACRAGLKYAKDVVAGKIPAAKYVRKSCQRHIDDLQRDRFAYRFDPARGERVAKFIQLLPHTKGRWAAKREKIKLEPWQLFFVTVLFGWVDKAGLRRFREAYVCVPRKNGKSIVAAGIGLYCLTADGEHGAEVYSGATSEKQAWEVFKPAKLMAAKTPDLCEAYDLQVNAKTLAIETDGSKFEPVIGNPGDGSSPSCAIVDEYHEHKTSDLYDTMNTGMGSREQPLMLVITTAGFGIHSPCFEKQEEAQSVLDGLHNSDRLFALIYGIDEDDDFADPAVLRKANPNFGVSVSADYLLDQQREAVKHARKQNTFRTKHLNQWVSAKEAYFNITNWQACADESLSLDDFDGEECWIGVDMAIKRDFAAAVKVFTRTIDGRQHYYVFPRLYLPEDRVEEDKTGKYLAWKKEGYLVASEGNEIDFALIQDDLKADAARFSVQAIPYDPKYSVQMSQILRDDGLPMVEFTQTPGLIGAPMDEFCTAIDSGRVHHEGNKAMGWMISNVINAKPNQKLPYPGKQSSENKIDGAVAAIMAVNFAMVLPDASLDSFLADPIAV